VFPRSNRFHLSFPIEIDDMVLLIFSERSIEEFLNDSKNSSSKKVDFVTPQNTRVFSLTDAIAIPGLFGLKKGSKIIDGKKMELIFDSAKIVSDGKDFEFTGNVKINGELETTDDLTVGGNVDASGELKGTDFNNGTLTFNGHMHPTAAVGIPSLPAPFVPPGP